MEHLEVASSLIAALGGLKTVVLLEDNAEHADAAREVVERYGYQLLVGTDWQTACLLADSGARFFVLDIKLGEGPDRVKGGLRALEVLRLRYGQRIFAAVLTVLKREHERSINKLGANIAVQKSNNREEDFRPILTAYERWITSEYAPETGEESSTSYAETALEFEADDLFPSDSLAVEITGATLNDLKELLQERRAIARALGEKLPHFNDLRKEIGDRMRDELRGVLVELAERANAEGKISIGLTLGARISKDLARLIYRYLPITYGADKILDQLWHELHLATRSGLNGEWGVVEASAEGEILLIPAKEDSDNA